MPLICVTGHQGTGKSTLLHEVRKSGRVAYGLDEEKIAGYFNLTTNSPSIDIPHGDERNLEWRKNNVWNVDIDKVTSLALAAGDEPTFYFGYANNIEILWDLCDEVIILELDDKTTLHRLQTRVNNSFGRHPGELQLALDNSCVIKKKAEAYTKSPVHFIDASSDIPTIFMEIIKLGFKVC